MSLWHEEEVVTARANELARDFVELEALGRGIEGCNRFTFGKVTRIVGVAPGP
jgi:hypothetical protein